jgi:hypothetical protein
MSLTLHRVSSTICKKMKFILSFIISALAMSTSGCGSWGGGGGKYYPLETAINDVGIERIKLNSKEYEKVFFPVNYTENEVRSKVVAEAYERWGEDRYFCEVIFNGEPYFIDTRHGLNLRDSDDRIVKELEIPRYARACASFPIKLKGQEYLIVYAEQQTTSHSSTLFILNTNLIVVYQDHLLGAIGIGYGHSIDLGNYIALKSEDFWYPNGHDTPTPKVKINGDWLYYLP